MKLALAMAICLAAVALPAAYGEKGMEKYVGESFSFMYPEKWTIYDEGVAQWDSWTVPVWAFGSDAYEVDSRLYVAEIPPVILDDERWSDSKYIARISTSEAEFCASGAIAWGRYACVDFEVVHASHYSTNHPYYLVVFEWVREYADGTRVEATAARIDVPGESGTMVMFAEAPSEKWDKLGLLDSIRSFAPSGGVGGPSEPMMTMLAENVYHYYDSYGTLVVIGEDDVLITDTANVDRAESLKKAITKITDTPVTMIALSHEHYDHVGGTGVFEDANVICHINCAPVFELSTFMDVPDKVDIEFDEYHEIDVGGITVELHHIAPADGDATTVVYLPDHGIVVTADLYTPGALTDGRWITDTNLLGTRKVLNEMASWDITHEINSHYPGTDPTNLRKAATFFDDLHDAVTDELAAGLERGGIFGVYTAMATMPDTLELPEYASWGNYEDLPRYIQRMAEAITHGD